MTEADRTPRVDRILVDLTIAAPADMVWDALCDQSKIFNWFGWDSPGLKEEIDFIFDKHARRDEAARIIRFEGTDDRFEVESLGESTRLRVIRSAPAGESWDGVYEDMTEGWISFVEQLRLAIEQHQLGPRRTLYYSGAALPGGSAPIAALGLGGLRDAEDGAPVSVDLPTGDRLDGQVWHRTDWQVGLTSPAWGNGLLIATDKSVNEASPHGRGMVILTTYGLSDSDFEALEARWTGWWNAHYQESSNSEPCS